MHTSFITLALCLTSALAIPLQEQIPFQQQTSWIDSLALPSLEHLKPLNEHIASLPEVRKIRTQDFSEHTITEGQKALLTFNGIRFDDITDELPLLELAAIDKSSAAKDLPKSLSKSVKQLQGFFDSVDADRMRKRLTKFSSFYTRYYRSPQGKESQHWLLSQVKEIAGQNPELNIKVSEFPHSWGQNSIIAHFPRHKDAKGKDKRIVIGAHQDSTNLLPFLSAPGADDDGSGTTTVLEVMHALVENNFVPANSSLELHWYSAEEGGLLGSAQVANNYHTNEIPVKAMLQMDMTAYVKPGTEARAGVISDFVSPELTKLVEKMVNVYTSVPPVSTKCGYACSDHSSWTKVGVPSAFIIEATFEDSNTGNIHSSRDTINVEGFSFEHMAEFARLSIAFANELSG